MPELQAFFANFTAATQAHLGNTNTSDQGPPLHYLRSMQMIGPESLAIYTKRIGVNRANPYFQPGAFRALGNGGLQVFEDGSCANSAPSVSGPANETISKALIEQSDPVPHRQRAGNPQLRPRARPATSRGRSRSTARRASSRT